MPSGRIHSIITVCTTLGTIPLANQVGLNPWLYALGGGIGLLVSPDLDVDQGNISEHFIRSCFPPLATIWYLFWKPYSVLMPHRSLASHFPIISTFIRLGYIFLLVNLIYWLVQFKVSGYVFFWNWSIFVGLANADTFHALADSLFHGEH